MYVCSWEEGGTRLLASACLHTYHTFCLCLCFFLCLPSTILFFFFFFPILLCIPFTLRLRESMCLNLIYALLLDLCAST
ncbi:hypothetical protein BZA77DRAFT_301182 [Pyronema omphalodes]|nr:hypothetical protein BZA77DRAFT_301182 [Pyronema omphalodes]